MHHDHHQPHYILSTDTHFLPPELDDIFRRVQNCAHYMPDWQMEVILTALIFLAIIYPRVRKC